LRPCEGHQEFGPPADATAGNGIFRQPKEISDMKFIQFAKRFAREEDGVTAIEYGLIAALIAVVIIGSVQLVGKNLDLTFKAIAAAL
jgi:pilus assembly protein Flp/PilA